MKSCMIHLSSSYPYAGANQLFVNDVVFDNTEAMVVFNLCGVAALTYKTIEGTG